MVGRKEIVNEEVVSLDTAKVEIVSPKQKMVEVKPNQDVDFYFGNQWYYLRKGETTKVSEELKKHLASVNALEVL